MSAPLPRDPVAQSTRLRIRPMVATDQDALGQVYGDLDAMRYVDDGTAISEEDCARWVQVTAANYTKRGYGMFVVELRHTGQLIGFCGLVHPGGQELPELKYAYHREFWGRGYATEAGLALCDYGRREFAMAGIIATVHPDHQVSQGVLGKCGFTLRETRRNDDGSHTAVWAWGEI